MIDALFEKKNLINNLITLYKILLYIFSED